MPTTTHHRRRSTMTACAICPRTAPDGQYACARCADDLRGWLAELPGQARLLGAEFLTPGQAPTRGRLGGTGRAHAPLPVDLRVLTLLGPGRYDPTGPDDDGTAPIAAILAAWAGHIAYLYPAAGRDAHGTAHVRPCEQAVPHQGPTITGWCTWLTAYLPYTLTQPVVAGLHDALGELVHRIRGLTHATPHRHPKAAPCPECDAFALVAVDGQWGITCTACGHHLEPLAYDAHAAAYYTAHQSTEPAPLDKIAT
ncbi:hypothetical protein AB0N31_10580 [Streptomyces sp. NPDC051051]|uniref:hypothetical protein n=1 Tax=Streptomyces sp. NPDC051051 TaxID=3155666 RepID=UPI00341213EC